MASVEDMLAPLAGLPQAVADLTTAVKALPTTAGSNAEVLAAIADLKAQVVLTPAPPVVTP